MFRVSDRTPPLEAAYAGTPGIDWSPWTLAMFTIAPPPCRRISGIANRLIR